jgi:hypothetical protein
MAPAPCRVWSQRTAESPMDEPTGGTTGQYQLKPSAEPERVLACVGRRGGERDNAAREERREAWPNGGVRGALARAAA